MPSKTFSVDFETSGFRRTSRQMDRIGKEADESGSKLRTAGRVGGAAIAAIGTAVTGAVAGMGTLVAKTAEYARQVDEAASQSGMTAESIQEIAFAAKQVSGAEFDTVRDGLKELAIRSEEAAMGTGEAKEAFDKLGISQQFLRDSSTAEIFQRVRQELQGASARMRTFAAETIFGGEAGERFTEMLQLSASEMQTLRSEAQQSGKVLSSSQVQALEQARMAWQSLTASVVGTGRQLAAQLAPIVTGTVIPAIRSMLSSVRSAVSSLTSMSDTTKGVIAVITGLASAVSAGFAVWAAWPAIVGGVTAAFSGLTTAATTAWAAITSPVTGVIAAVAAVAGSAALIYDNWSGVTDLFSSVWSAVTTSARAFGSVLLSIFRGAWLEVRALFAKSINGLISLINSGLRKIGAEGMTIEGEIGVPSEAITANEKRLRRLSQDLNNALGEGLADTTQAGSELISGFGDSITDAHESAKAMFSDIGGFFSVEGGGAETPDSDAPTAVGGGGSGGFEFGDESASAGQEETLIDQEMPNLSAKLDLQREKMGQLKRVGVATTNSLKRGFNSVFSGMGRLVSGLVTGREKMRSFGQVAVRALEDVIRRLTTMIAKMAVMKSLKLAFSIGTGGAGGLVGGLLGFANGGIVTGPTLGVLGEGTEDEAVMPLSKLNRFINGGGARGGTVQSAGGARLAQGRIEIPVEVVDRAQNRGSQNLSRTGRS